MHRIKNISFLALCAFFITLISFSSQNLCAQTDPRFYEFPQNHLQWYTIESDHFLIHFQEGSSRSAKLVSRIAEEIYKPINDFYEYTPDSKISIVLKDREDYSNGAAYFFDNKIDIWLPALDTPLRGTHNWLRNVITHEYTHIVQIQKGMKRSRKIPAFYLQWLSYENVRRPDVLYGYPNGIVTLPFATVNMPAWLAEGTAQYQIPGLMYDNWDSHRDMILRTRILTDTHFTLAEMGTFSSKTSLEREAVYNQGYAFVIYLADRFGPEVLKSITEALGERNVFNVAEAIEIATGKDGNSVFDDFIEERRSFYKNAVSGIQPGTSQYIEKEGFYNFYAKYSPDGKKFAYLSNRGVDYGALTLYLEDEADSLQLAVLNENLFSGKNHAHAVEPIVPIVSTSYSFSPGSGNIVYSVNKRNKFGEFYRDLFIYNLEKGENVRLTNDARIKSPAWNPTDSTLIAAVQYSGGTENLVLVHADQKDSLRQLTSFNKGETIFTPQWSADGKRIFFAGADRENRNLYIFDTVDGSVTSLLSDSIIDYRDPYPGPQGNYLYFSADPDGIFNIYRLDLNTGEQRKLTNVIGGAFMPSLNANNELIYSEYEAEGYKIKRKTISDMLLHPNEPITGYTPVFDDSLSVYQLSDDYVLADSLNRYDDTDLEAFTEMETANADTGRFAISITDNAESGERTYSAYEETFTSFSVFPVLRFDNYSKPNGSNSDLIKTGKFGDFGDNILRDMKPGMYFSSRDVLDRLTFFGGLMVGVASRPAETIGGFFQPSRLLDLDRDAFLLIEQRGVPFIKRSWSPTVSVELFNIRRNVEDGLAIEEFPCTSCLPDTTNADIAYDIWQANLFLRSKINRWSLLELGIGYSPYRVSTENFFSRELKQDIPGSSSEYFRATTLSAAYTFYNYLYSVDGDIAPIGLKGYLRYQYQPAKLLEEYEVDDGILRPVFKSIRNHSMEFHARYGFRSFGRQAFQARVRAFSYFNNPEDAFYSDYIGGFLGMRSYPFFALGGNTTAFSSLSWFTPILKNVGNQYGPYSVDKVYARFFFETGNGWNSPFDTGNNLKSGIGAELRVAMNGYYLFPIKFFVSTSYGFNRFTLTLPDDFITGSQNNRVTYGRELLFHFGLTFDFELL